MLLDNLLTCVACPIWNLLFGSARIEIVTKSYNCNQIKERSISQVILVNFMTCWIELGYCDNFKLLQTILNLAIAISITWCYAYLNLGFWRSHTLQYGVQNDCNYKIRYRYYCLTHYSMKQFEEKCVEEYCNTKYRSTNFTSIWLMVISYKTWVVNPTVGSVSPVHWSYQNPEILFINSTACSLVL